MSERERAPPCRDTRGSSGGARVWAGQPDRPPRSPSVRLRARRPLKTRLLAGAIRSTQPMLSITTKSPYALRALAELGRSGEGPVPIGELARRREIPVQFLEQLFAVLRRAGVLRSQRGVKGGYSFARPPHEITVLESSSSSTAPSAARRPASSPTPPRPPATSSRPRPSPMSSSARRARPARRCTTSEGARVAERDLALESQMDRCGTALDRWDPAPDCTAPGG